MTGPAPDREEGFVIMQIGDPQMDRVYTEAIEPAVVGAGLTCRRVDRHNTGGLLQNEIAAFIERSAIVVADLTNERPNCYLEVGFAIGLGRLSALVLSARADHKPDRPGRSPSDPKVHFDLSSYDILYWDPDDLVSFREDLLHRIQRRRLISARGRSGVAEPVWDEDWLEMARRDAQAGLDE